jgi:hypothetical protein
MATTALPSGGPDHPDGRSLLQGALRPWSSSVALPGRRCLHAVLFSRPLRAFVLSAVAAPVGFRGYVHCRRAVGARSVGVPLAVLPGRAIAGRRAILSRWVAVGRRSVTVRLAVLPGWAIAGRRAVLLRWVAVGRRSVRWLAVPLPVSHLPFSRRRAARHERDRKGRRHQELRHRSHLTLSQGAHPGGAMPSRSSDCPPARWNRRGAALAPAALQAPAWSSGHVTSA